MNRIMRKLSFLCYFLNLLFLYIHIVQSSELSSAAFAAAYIRYHWVSPVTGWPKRSQNQLDACVSRPFDGRGVPSCRSLSEHSGLRPRCVIGIPSCCALFSHGSTPV